MRVTRRTAGVVLTSLVLSAAVAAQAHAAATPVIRLAGPVAGWHVASTQGDGANASVHLAADVTGLTAAELAAVSVRFAAKPSAGVRANIATDASAPYSVEWAPTAGTYDITAEVLDNAGTVTASTTTTGVTVSSSASSVHIGQPADGGLLGWYKASGASTGYVAVSGTRSTSGPRVDVSLGTAWNAAALGTAAALAGNQSWSLAAPFNPPTAPTGDTVTTTVPTWVTAAALDGSVTASDEAVPVSLYLQRVNAATTPTTVNGAKNADLPIAVTVTDQFGRPIVGLPVTGTGTGGTTTVTGASTDERGVAHLTASNTAAGTSTLTLSTKFGAAYDATADRQATTTLTTYTAVPTTLVLASAPIGPVLPAASYNSMVVTATLRDQHGNLLAGAAVNAKETVTRTTNGATTSKVWATGTGLAPTTDSQGRITLSHDTAVNGSGTDIFDLYLEQDGVAGRTSGDLRASSLSVQWATSLLTVDPCTVSACAGQLQVGTARTYTVREALGGVPSVGRALTLSVASGSGASFTAAQPGGTARTSATSATCTTNGSGACAFSVTGSVVQQAVVSISDTGPSGASGAAAATLTLSVRARPVAFTNVSSLSTTVIDPLGAATGSAARPGGALVYRATIRDVANLPIANSHVTVAVNHGYFTRNTGDGSAAFGKLTFVPAPVNGAIVAQPVNVGTTIDAVTDGSGVLTVTVALGRDEGLDLTGVVSVVPTFTADGSSVTAAALGSFTTDGSRLPATPAGIRDPMNRDALQPLVLTDSVTGHLLTGFVPITQTRSVLMWVRDSFGNLTRPANALSLSLSGVGALATTARVASYTNDLKPVVLSSTVAGNTSITASLSLPITTFTVSGAAVGAVARSTLQTSTVGPIQWYTPVVTIAGGAEYNVTRTPSMGAYAVGTGVTFALLARDQHQQPLKNLSVTIDRIGPGNVTPGHFTLTTDAEGKVSYALTGAAQGNVTVEFVVRSSGVELYRSLTRIGFDGAPTIAAPGSRNGTGPILISGVTRAGARVVLQKKEYGAAAFVRVGSTVAGSGGAYVLKPIAGRSATWRVTVDGVATSGTKYVRVFVNPTLTLTTTAGTLTARITTDPVAIRAVVSFYRVNADGTKTAMGSATTNSLGKATRTWTLPRGRTLTIIAFVNTVDGISGHWSKKVALRVR
ncbi:MAG: hypothetical protein JWM93_1794 [Frankiales bacterium]|nr:hypothetical protein [Frankiales bacterium]